VYRFCENDKTSCEAVLQSHCYAACQRIAAQPVVILPQDTTEIEVTRPGQQVAGAGPLDGDTRRGALLHVLRAFTPDGTPLGTVHAEARVREEGAVCAQLSRAERAAIPIGEKESHRWITTLQQANAEAQRCQTTQFVCAADSEADIYEVLVEGTREPGRSNWSVRAGQNRALLCEKGGHHEEKDVQRPTAIIAFQTDSSGANHLVGRQLGPIGSKLL